MKGKIRDICLRSGFTIKEGETDLKPYVFEAGEKLIRAGQAMALTALDGKERRERIAMRCLQGLLANPETIGTFNEIAYDAVKYADALIAELDKEQAK